ncbi:MAG TPA: hypothetical protein VFV08_09895, partial [Puia sp.]|nr:hypothetical protein [Puia sp.]
MPTNYHIEYIRREAIDTSQWDRCIEDSANSLIYAHSFYLDNMAKNWDALILNNYEAIMPLTWNQKWGMKYLYQPPLTQQLGIFSRKSIGDEVRKAFINEATKHYRFAEIYFNYFNNDPGCKPCNNYILSLNTNYEDLQNAYAADLIKNLKRSSRFELHYRKENDLTLALKLHE